MVFTGASLDAGAGNSLTITISGTISPDATGPLANTAELTVPAGAGYTDPAAGNNTATDTDTALPQQVDLAIAKSDGQTSYVPGAPIRYTLVVTNAGPSTATDVRVTDTVPAAITGVTAHCVAAGLARCGTTERPRQQRERHQRQPAAGRGQPSDCSRSTAPSSPDTTGDLVNTATVTAAAGAIDTAPANNTATDTDTQGAGVADLLVSKTDGTAVYTPGVPITYQIVVINDGPSNAVGFAIDDVVPAAITGVGASCVVTSGDGTCGTNDTAGNTVAFSGVTLTAGSTLTVTVTGTIDPAATGDLTNTATVTVPGGAGFTDPDPTSNAATDIDTLGSPAGRSGDHEGRRPDELCAGDTDQLHGDGDQRRTVHGDRRLPDRRAAGRDHQPDGDLRGDRRGQLRQPKHRAQPDWKRGRQPAAGQHADDHHRRHDRPGRDGRSGEHGDGGRGQSARPTRIRRTTAPPTPTRRAPRRWTSPS